MGFRSTQSPLSDAAAMEQALERLEATIDHAPTTFRAEAADLAVEADRAGCPELAMIARLLSTAAGKAGPRALLSLAHKALAARASLGRTPRLAEDPAVGSARPGRG